MPFIFNWHDQDQTIIRIDIVGQVSWDEYGIVTDRIVDELAKVNHRVDVIYNDKVGMPKGNPMPHLKANLARIATYKNLGVMCSVSSRSVSSFAKIMIEIMMRAYNIDNTHSGGFVTTMEEALAIIEKSRASEKASMQTH